MGLLDEIDDGAVSANSLRLRAVVPGYDYRSQESFKETDEQLRTKLRRDLTEVKQRLDEVHDDLYDSDRRAEMEAVASVRDSVETIQRRVEAGQSGGGGVRDLVVDDESHLVALIEYDATLVEQSETLVEEGLELVEKGDDADLRSAVEAYEREVQEFRRAFRSRRDYLDGLR